MTMKYFVSKFKALLFFFFILISPVCFLVAIKDNKNVHEELLIKTINQLGLRLFPTLTGNGSPPANSVFSPLSVTLALSMVHLGAANTTASEIEDCLFDEHVTEGLHFHNWWKSLLKSIIIIDISDAEGIVQSNVNKLSLANALWLSLDFEKSIQTQFQSKLKEYYNTTVKTVDFSTLDSITEINNWVSVGTGGKIKSLIENDIGKEVVLILANVLYFKGLWQEAFLVDATYDSRFVINSTSTINVKMMRKKSFYHLYKDHDLKLQILKLPYLNDTFAMFVALSQDVESISQTYLHLTNKQMDLWERSVKQMTVDVHLPKFTMHATYKLEQVFKNLGVAELFDHQRADLSRISLTEPLHISSFVHKSYIEVNEQGTEASAASAMHIRKRSLDPQFIADHPFVFWIRHIKTRTILFLGQVVSPSFGTTSTEQIFPKKAHNEL